MDRGSGSTLWERVTTSRTGLNLSHSNPHLCLKPLSQEIEAASARTSLQGVSERRRHEQGGAREA